MKKLMATILAAFMVLAAAGTAAAFSDGSLTAVVYKRGDVEIAWDLGNLSTGIDFTQENVVLGTFDINEFNTVASTSELRIGIFGSIQSAYTAYYATTVEDSTPNVSALGILSGFGAGASAIYGIDQTNAATRMVISADSTSDYDYKMNLNGTSTGTYTGANLDFSVGEGQLVEDGIIDMYLYGFVLGVEGGMPVTNAVEGGVAGAHLAKISVITDGTTGQLIMNQAVPVPGAILMMGTGLIALAGLRRRS